MSTFYKMDVTNSNLTVSLQGLFKTLLDSDEMDALLVPWRLPAGNNVMPTLITDSEQLDQADPAAPCFPINTAKIASRLTRKPSGKKIGIFMRPCEIRAFAELTKLKQGMTDHLVIISMDCMGAYTNTDFARFTSEHPDNATQMFYRDVLDNKKDTPCGIDLASACQVCEHPVSHTADINIGLYGGGYQSDLTAEALTQKGQTVLTALALTETGEPSGRNQAVKTLVSDRTSRRDEMFATVSETASSIDKLTQYFSACVNCYNCRVACPVCYCRECVFVTDVFDHDPFQYLDWAGKKGKIKMPTDTDFFHMTRMAHIGLTCVGCGQCSNACPNDIPVMEVFRTVAYKVQQDFEYEAGRSFDEPIPFSVFNDKEYEEVVGVA